MEPILEIKVFQAESRGRVLVVNDCPDFCRLLAAIIGKHLPAVETAYRTRAMDAADLLEEEHFDMVISAARLEGFYLNYLAVLAQVKWLHLVTLITAGGCACTGQAKEALDQGAHEFIELP